MVGSVTQYLAQEDNSNLETSVKSNFTEYESITHDTDFWALWIMIMSLHQGLRNLVTL